MYIPPKDLHELFPSIEEEGLLLLQKMLLFGILLISALMAVDPKKRITAAEAIQSPYFDSIRKKELEVFLFFFSLLALEDHFQAILLGLRVQWTWFLWYQHDYDLHLLQLPIGFFLFLNQQVDQSEWNSALYGPWFLYGGTYHNNGSWRCSRTFEYTHLDDGK